MFGRRRAASVQRAYQRARDGDERPLHEGGETDGDGALNASVHRRTLSTLCRCGHPRREHTGLQIDYDGRCLECDCRRFVSAEDTAGGREEILHRIDAAIAHVGRLHDLVERRLGQAPVARNGARTASGAGAEDGATAERPRPLDS
jgi:hypothetical protein